MFKRKVAANPKQYDHQREKGMSTFYHLPKNKSLQCESNIEGPTRQRFNPVLTEEEESAMRDH